MRNFFVVLFFNICLFSYLLAGTTYAKEFSDYKVIQTRNLFTPIWKSKKVESTVEFRQKYNLALFKKQQQEEKLRHLKEAEGLAKLQKEQEQRDLENKKVQIKQGYKLNGIFYDNGALQSVVIDNRNVTHFVKVNENLNDLKVVSIDEKKGSIKLSYQDKIEIILYME